MRIANMKYLFLLLMLFCFSANALTQKDKETFEFCLKHNIKDCRAGDTTIINQIQSKCGVNGKDCYTYDENNRIKSQYCVGKNENC